MNIWLLLAGTLSSIAALLHLGCIYFGASWYRFFGAGEHMAILAEQGNVKPTLITLGIFCVLAVWSVYAFAAAGLLKSLPLMRVILCIITGIYLLRGVAGFFLISNPLGRSEEFWLYSSAVCIVFGFVHLVGLVQRWPLLSTKVT